MPISGKVYLVPRPEQRKWDLVVHNTGDRPLGVTTVWLDPGQDQRRDVGDDFRNHGHGLLTGPNSVSRQSFAKGQLYEQWKAQRQVRIDEDCFVRIGLRGAAEATVRPPALDGKPLVLDLAEDFRYYAGDPKTARVLTTGTGSWANQSMDRLHHRGQLEPNLRNPDAVLAEIDALLDGDDSVKCEGRASVVPVGEGGQLVGWDVRFENTGAQPWIGTVAFSASEGKNAGRGLESMACPHEGSAAVQRIHAYADYGTSAVPGAKLRLGVRGYATQEVELPRLGQEVALSLRDFTRDTRAMSDEYFELEAVRSKRAEKMKAVQFFEAGEAINGALKPKVFAGHAAVARADFDPPALTLTRGAEGWTLELESALPPEDDQGQLSFVGTVKILRQDGTRTLLGPKRFTEPGEKKVWDLPRGGKAGLEPGDRLMVGTRGLGWYAILELPEEGTAPVDTTQRPELWRFREDQFNRDHLHPAFTAEVKD